ncbi:MAG: hypothetical protein HQL87_17410, partial [Magnetococcales bacterium]|nr:hypothetical protein [Magnetococcales bacterium]
MVIGDNGVLNYDTDAKDGIIRQMANTDIVIGGDDTITLREGYKVVLGGYGNDSITLNGGTLTGAGVPDAVGVREVTGIDAATNTVDRKGRSGRYVAGDNAQVTFDAKGGLTGLLSTDAISATGGADVITLGARDFTGNLGLQVVIGGMGNDKMTVRPATTSEDVLFGDNADYERSPLTYENLQLASIVPEQGDNDTIIAGQGNKIVVGGAGSDTITLNTLNDADSSIVLGDSGVLNFALSGSGLLEKIASLAPAFGGNDTVTIGDGDVNFIGGFGSDQLAVNSTRTARRTAVGDNAVLLFGVNSNQKSALTQLTTTDQSASTGGSDTLRIGPTGSITGDMGDTLLVGGMSTDTLVINGASATSTLVGDNVDLRRTTAGQLLSLTSLLLDQGGGDVLSTISGSYVIVGGMGGDTIHAGSGPGVVLGDSGSLVFDASGSGVLRTATSLGLALGGNDNIALGTGGATVDGNKVVIGGYGADTLNILSVHGEADVMTERSVAGDNAGFSFDSAGHLTQYDTLDADLSTGGKDSITIIMSGDAPTGSPLTDLNVVAGGMSDDSINMIGATRSEDIISGDNLDYRRGKDKNGVYQSLFADASQPRTGGADTIRTGSGDKVIFGGAGVDRITTLTLNGDRNVIFGDAGSVIFSTDADGNATGQLSQIFSTAETSGDTDTLVVGGGESYLVGGLGNDNITLNTADSNTRVVAGDNAQFDFTNGVATAVQSTDSGSVDDSTTIDTFNLPTFGTSIVVGGPGVDLKSGGHADNDEILPGSGSIDIASRVISVVTLGAYNEMGITDPTLVEPAASSGGAGGAGGTETITVPLVLTGTGTVKEDGVQQATGGLVYPALSGGLATFVVSGNGVVQADGSWIYTGTYGTLTLHSDGSWGYLLANSSQAVQHLKTGDSPVDTFVVQTADGSRTSVAITVQGTDDVAVLGGDTTGTVKEDTTTRAVGQLTGSNVDGDVVAFQAGTLTGRYGQLVLDNTGAWQYTLANNTQAVQSLHTGQSVSDPFTVTANGVTATVTITVQGTTDATVLGGVTTGTVTEDGTTQCAGQLTGSNGDGDVITFQAATQTSNYGQLTVDSAGAWQYTLANNTQAVQSLHTGQSVNDPFTVTANGVTATVTITVQGTTDATVIGGVTTGAVTEDGTTQCAGQLTGSNGDGDGVTFQAATLTSNYGQLALDNTGAWQYTLANDSQAGEARHPGQSGSDPFTITATVTITINGTDDVTVIGGDTTGTVTEDTVTSCTGRLTGTDGDGDPITFQVATPVGHAGQLALDGATGAWTYTLDNHNPQVQALRAGETALDTFAITANDGQTTLTITLIGTNDLPVVTGTQVGAVQKDGTTQASGQLVVVDADTGESAFQVGVQTGLYGTLDLEQAANGTWQWQYTLANSS